MRNLIIFTLVFVIINTNNKIRLKKAAITALRNSIISRQYSDYHHHHNHQHQHQNIMLNKHCLSKYQNIMLKAKSRLPLQHCQPHHHHHHSAECVVRTIIGFTAFRSQFSCPAVQLCRQQFVLSFYREGQANAINDSLDPDFMNTKVSFCRARNVTGAIELCS